MGEIIHTSHVKVVQLERPLRHAFLEHFPEPVPYGIHTAIAKFYGVQPKEEHPATLDHLIAAVAG